MSSIKIQHLSNACEDGDSYVHGSNNQIELVAAIEQPIVLQPKARAIIPTGIALQLPSEWEAQIRPLPSMAKEHGITVLNSPGTIDPDYRGEVMVILINFGEADVTIKRGTPIAIMGFAPFVRVVLVPTDNLEGTARSDKGLGSTGQ